jgi:two-component system sensor histidine kinase MprB
MSLRARLALISALAVAAAVVLAATISYFLVRNRLLDEADNSVRSTAVRLAEVPAPEISFPYFDFPVAGTTTNYVQVVRADGETVRPENQRVELPVSSDDLALARNGGETTVRDIHVGERHLVMATAPYQDGAVQIAQSLGETDATIDDLRVALFVVGVSGVAVAALLALLMGGAILRPVAKLTRAAEHVAETQDLSATIDVRRQDELGRLAGTLNAMLSALDESREQQRRLVSDASHELRTPLTSLRTNIEVLARQPGMAPDERRRLVDDVMSQLDELTVLMDDLSELARDSAAPPEALTDLELDTLVSAAVERAERRAIDVGIELEIGRPGRVHGRRQQLERAVVNVLDNACKWSPPGARVEVRVDGGDITVRDHGPGVEPDDVPHVFERFYRAPSARSRPGSGLGLAIVGQVVDDHRGSVHLETAPGGGTLVSISLPVVGTVQGTDRVRAPTSI